MIGTCLSALAGHWRRRPGQAFVLVLGLAVATALWTGVQAINAQARQSYDTAEALLAGDRLDSLTRSDGQPLSEADFVTLRRGGWRVSPILEGRLRRDGRSYRLVGIDVLTLPVAAAFGSGEPAALGGFIAPPYQTLAHPETIADLTADDLPPSQAADTLPPDTLLVPIGIAQRLLDRPGAVSRLVLSPDQKAARRALADLGPYRIEPPQAQSGLGSLTDSFHLNLTAFGLMAFVVGLFIVHGTIGLAFEQRRALMRTLRALGVPLRSLILSLLAEIALLATLAGLVGVVLGYLIAAALLPGVAASLGSLYGATVPGALSLSPVWWLGGLAMALVGALVAAASHLWAIARMEVLAPARQQAWLEAARGRLILQLALSAAAVVIAVGTVLWGHGLISGFVVMGSTLVAAALALPALVFGLLGVAARRAKGAVAQWFWADTRAQLNSLSLALMALLLALAINIGVGTMVGGFRLTFLDWLDQRLAADIYIQPNSGPDRDRLAAALARRPEVVDVLPIENADIRVEGWPVGVMAVVDHPHYRQDWPLLEAEAGVWDAVMAGKAVLISEQTARRLDLRIGASLPLPGWQPRIAGIFADYGNPNGAILLHQSAFAPHFPPAARHSAAVLLTDSAPPAAEVIARLAQENDLGPSRIIDQAGLKAQAQAVFENTFAITAALNALTLAVAGLALTTALLTLAQIRLPQLAPVWAMGLTRAALARIELARALMLALVTALCAIPLGLLFAWVLTAIINVEAFGWKLPLYIFPGQWLGLGALALLTSALASLWPVIRLQRTPPADLIKVFCNDQ
ncbi:ABC transporter permease [Halovulum sp. GXIMD14793]